MDDDAIAKIPQVSSRTMSKWHEFLTCDQVRAFEKQYGDLIVTLGYQRSEVS
jgi:hypothetical protein